jgi:hypothetical protein
MKAGSPEVKIVSVEKEKVNVTFNGNPKGVSYDLLADEELLKRSKRFYNGLIAYYFHKKQLPEGLANMTLSMSKPLEKLLLAGSGKLPTSLKAGVTGRYVEVWKSSNEPATSAKWKLKLNSGSETLSAGNSRYDMKSIHPLYQKKDYTVKAKVVYLHDFKQDVNIEGLKFDKVVGSMKFQTVIIRNSVGQITWQRTYSLAKSIKNSTILVSARFLVPKNNFALNKTFTQTDKSNSAYGINDGLWVNSSPFFYATGKTAGSFPKTVTIDLGKERAVNALRFGRYSKSKIKQVIFQVSIDNKTFTEVGTHTFYDTEETPVTLFIKGTKAKYIRIVFPDDVASPQRILTELEVYHF